MVQESKTYDEAIDAKDRSNWDIRQEPFRRWCKSLRLIMKQEPKTYDEAIDAKDRSRWNIRQELLRVIKTCIQICQSNNLKNIVAFGGW